MKFAVVYATKTGHSKKIATAVAAGLGVDAYDVKKTPILEKIDLLYIVGGIYGGKSLREMMDYVKTLKPDNIKKAALITSSASKSAKQTDVRKALIDNGIEVIEEEFKCPGSFMVLKLGHPNDNEIKNAVEFALKTSNE
ncbi:MAG: flavodoxin domain-containing protein [Christensenellales bacterium]|jgi:flavodoxin